MTRLLTVDEAAASVFVPRKTVETWLQRGLLVAPAPGLVWEQAVADVELATRRRPRAQRLAELARR